MEMEWKKQTKENNRKQNNKNSKTKIPKQRILVVFCCFGIFVGLSSVYGVVCWFAYIL
jgi:hypothetical protein